MKNVPTPSFDIKVRIDGIVICLKIGHGLETIGTKTFNGYHEFEKTKNSQNLFSSSVKSHFMRGMYNTLSI